MTGFASQMSRLHKRGTDHSCALSAAVGVYRRGSLHSYPRFEAQCREESRATRAIIEPKIPKSKIFEFG
jgi:hypothetical protein